MLDSAVLRQTISRKINQAKPSLVLIWERLWLSFYPENAPFEYFYLTIRGAPAVALNKPSVKYLSTLTDRLCLYPSRNKILSH